MSRRAFFFEFALSGVGTGELVVAAVMNNQMEEEHQDKDDPKGNDDGGAGGSIELHTEIATESGNDGAHSPADCETRPDLIREEHGADARHDQITEDEENAGDRNRRGHDKAERSVEEEIPKAHVQAEL